MKVLIVDCNIFPEFWGAADLRAYHSLKPEAEFTTRRAPQEDLPKDLLDWDGVIISGSFTSALAQEDWVLRLEDKLLKRLEKKRPTLGICFGHQMICRALGGMESVRLSKKREFGWTLIHRIDQHPFFGSLPKSFYSFSSHYDEVVKLPEHFVVLARSENCQIQAFAEKEAPLLGVQFHPEKNIDSGWQSYLEQKKKGKQQDFMNPNRGKELYNPLVGKQIFSYFFGCL